VARFQLIAPTRPPKTTVGVIASASTIPPATVAATSSEMNAPTKLSTAAIATATFGRSAPVAIVVAMALAVSWNPLVKSNPSAVTTTSATMMSPVTAREPRSRCDGAPERYTDSSQPRAKESVI
jgi:hypothetical protein